MPPSPSPAASSPAAPSPGAPTPARPPLASALALLPYIGAIGAILYGVLRLAFVFFYMQVRTTPEEVGFGYAEVLASQTVGAAWLILILAVPLLAVGLLVRALARARHPAGERDHPAAATPSTIGVAGVVKWAVAASTLVVLLGLPFVAWAAGGDAARGFTVRNVYLLGTLRLPVLAVQAVPAHVRWASEPPATTRPLEDRQCLLYLGQAGGIAVFYDVASGQSIRLPAHSIAVTLENTTGVPEGC